MAHVLCFVSEKGKVPLQGFVDDDLRENVNIRDISSLYMVQ